LVFVSACRPGFNSMKLTLAPLTPTFKGTFVNRPSQSLEEFDQTTLAATLLVEAEVGETIDIYFVDRDSLVMKGVKDGKPHEWRYRGDFTPDGYYRITFRNNVEKGLINASRDEKRVYFQLTDQGSLMVEDYIRNERRFLLWGVGGTIHLQRVYPLLR